MNIALIIGCARSGTSIFSELIASHPDVKYIHESDRIWGIGGLGENESHRLTEEHATPEVIESVKRSVREQPDTRPGRKLLTVAKSPRNTLRVPYVRKIYPEAKIVHIIRDGRDVAVSLVPGIGGTEWSHLKPPAWKSLMLEEPMVRCAKVWRDAITIAFADLDAIPHLVVKYEDLLLAPQEVATTVLEYLGLRSHQSVMHFCRNIQNSTRGSYHAQLQVQWYRNDHVLRVGRWRENLNLEQQWRVEAILKGTLTRLGYSLDSTK